MASLQSIIDATARMVMSHSPRMGSEAACRSRTLGVLAELSDPFDRDANPTHVTASAIVAGPLGTLLHMHRRERRWLQPGGHIDRGETPWDAAVRETREETGIEARHPQTVPRLISIDEHVTAQGHRHLDLRYLLVADADEPQPGESVDVGWFAWDEAAVVTSTDPALTASLAIARALMDARAAP